MTGIGNPTCRFILSSSNVGVPGIVTVSLASGATLAEFVRAQHAAVRAVPVATLGDRAYYVPRTATLQAFRNGKWLVLQASLRVPGIAPPKPGLLRDDLVRLGRSVATGL